MGNRIFGGAAALLLVAAVAAGADVAAGTDGVSLRNGDVLAGRVVARTADVVIVDHPALGRIELPASLAAAADEGAPKPAEPAWKSRLELGLNGSGGNADTLGFIAGATSDYERPGHRWHAESRYFLKKTDHETTESRAYGLLRKDWTFEKDSRTSLFAEGRYDRDQFQDWTQRATVSAGVAYRFIKEERLEVGFRVGGAATKEWGTEGPDREHHVRPEGLLGVEAKWRIDDRKEFTFQSTYYPDLSDRPEYRLLSSAGLAVQLDDKGSATVRAGVEHEYDTHRRRPFDRTDYRYFLLLVVDF